MARPMLADNKKVEQAMIAAHLAEDGFLIMQPKIDGMRALIDEECIPRTRSWKEHKNRYLREFARHHPSLRGFDGEVVSGLQLSANTFRESMSGIRSQDGSPEFTFYAFDFFMGDTAQLGYQSRREHLLRNLDNLGADSGTVTLGAGPEGSGVQYTAKVILCPQKEVRTLDEVNEHEEELIKAGWEGAMLRRAHLPYKYNRSTNREGYLIKLKRYEDDEAVIISCYPWEQNNNEATTDARGYTVRSAHQGNKEAQERLGGFHCRLLRDPSVEFDIGVFRGWGHSDRDSLWAARDTLPGRILKFKHQGYGGGYDKPRTPVGLGWRDADDL